VVPVAGTTGFTNMPSGAQSPNNPLLRPGSVTAARIAKGVDSATVNPFSQGVIQRRLPGGTTLDLRPKQSVKIDHPFRIRAKIDGDDVFVTASPGAVNDEAADLTEVSEAKAGPLNVYLKHEFTMTFDDTENFLIAAVYDGPSVLELSASTLTSSIDGDTFTGYTLLGTLEDGRKTAQFITTSLYLRLCSGAAGEAYLAGRMP
jgi:hypothetical protein